MISRRRCDTQQHLHAVGVLHANIHTFFLVYRMVVDGRTDVWCIAFSPGEGPRCSFYAYQAHARSLGTRRTFFFFFFSSADTGPALGNQGQLRNVTLDPSGHDLVWSHSLHAQLNNSAEQNCKCLAL